MGRVEHPDLNVNAPVTYNIFIVLFFPYKSSRGGFTQMGWWCWGDEFSCICVGLLKY